VPFLFPASAAAAPPQLQGRVVDKVSGQPIKGAEVSILGHPGERFTDADGRFTWQPSPPPPFEILVILPGGVYTKPVLVERVPESGAIDIPVESLVSESVTVAAGVSPNIESTPGAAQTLVTGTDIAARAPANLAQALENIAGVSTVSEGHAAVPAVRGFAAGRTLVMIDGARVSSERRAGASATYLDPFALESVEVSRGPGSVAYGSDAFGGVIFARTRRVAPGSALAFRFTGSAGVGIPELRTGVEAGKGLARGGVLFQAHGRNIEDYRSPRGDVFNSGTSDSGFLGRFEHEAGPGTFSVALQSDFGRDIERPRSNAQTVRFYYPIEDSHRFTAAYELRKLAGFERISTTGFLGSYRNVTDQDRYATATSPRSIERADVAANDFSTRVLAERTLGSAHLEFGIDINGRFDLEALEESILYDPAGAIAREDRRTAIEDAHRTDAALFGSIQVPLASRILFGGGIRGDRVTTENTGGYFGDRSTAHGAGSGFASLTVGSFGGFTFTGQVARGFRDPLLSDRYYRGPTGRGFITGNPDLEPETSIQYDGAVRYTAGRYRVAFYGFHYRIHDLIERYETEPDFFLFRNRGRARMQGFEIETQADLGTGYTLEIAGQVTDGRALDDESGLDGVPPASLSVQLRRQFSTYGFVQLRGAAFDRDEDQGPTERVTPGYAVFDLSGGWNVTPRVELRMIARNLFDKAYLVSPDSRTVPAPGVSALLTLNVKVGG
jgi:iron complex outermembrane receptor protein